MKLIAVISQTTSIALAAVLVFAFAGVASADPIIITDLSRHIGGRAAVQEELFGQIFVDEFGQATADTGVFAASRTASVGLATAAASQNSTIDVLGGRWFGSGNATARFSLEPPVADIQSVANSTVSISFTVVETTRYHVRGALSGTEDGIGQMALFGAGWNEDASGGRREFEHRGLLSPGTYQFFAEASVGRPFLSAWSGNGAFDFDFTLGSAAPVPEPASIALLGTALAGVILNRRRQRAAD